MILHEHSLNKRKFKSEIIERLSPFGSGWRNSALPI